MLGELKYKLLGDRRIRIGAGIKWGLPLQPGQRMLCLDFGL